MRIVMHQSKRTVHGVRGAQQRQGYGMIAADRDGQDIVCVQATYGGLDRLVGVEDREGRKQHVAAVDDTMNVEGLHLEFGIVAADPEAAVSEAARSEP